MRESLRFAQHCKENVLVDFDALAEVRRFKDVWSTEGYGYGGGAFIPNWNNEKVMIHTFPSKAFADEFDFEIASLSTRLKKYRNWDYTYNTLKEEEEDDDWEV